MVLLTSSQVSLAISSTIVFLFTSALFLAGYTIQQNTVRGLQEAIKPAPRTAHDYVYLPKAFAKDDPESIDIHNSQDTPDDANSQNAAGGWTTGADNDEKPALFAEVLKGVADIHLKSQPQKEDFRDRPPTFDDKNRKLPESPHDEKTPEDGKLERLSRAERRKRIKMDIEEMTAEDRNGYKRRQW